MEEGGGSPTTNGLLGSGLPFNQQNTVYSSCSPNFIADVFGATKFQSRRSSSGVWCLRTQEDRLG